MIRAVYVDSSPSNDVEATLRDAGGEPVVVETAADCLSTLSSADCVVIGALPDESVVELCSQIRTRRPDIPIVVAPVDGSERLAGDVVAAGADGYVPRSQDQGRETLASRLRDLVGNEPTDRLRDEANGRLRDGESNARFGGDPRRATALEALQETAHELLRAESIDEIASIVVAATDHIVERPLASIRFYDEETAGLEPAGTTAELDDLTDGIERIDAESDASILWDAYADAEPTVVDDASSTDGASVLGHAVGTVVCHPLGEHGLLAVGSPVAGDLDTVGVHLVHVLAATAEAALDRAARDREREQAEAIVESVGDSVYSLDRAGNFVTVNDTMTDVTGYDRDELVGRHISTILTPESVERRRKRIRALSSVGTEAIAAYEVTLETRDGTLIPCEINTTSTGPGDELEGTVGIIRDISDRKRMQRELVAHEAKIESLHEVASRLDDCETRQEIYDLTVEAAEEVLNFDVCVVDIAEGDVLVKKALSTELDAGYARAMPIDEGIAGKTYRTNRTYRIEDIAAADDANPENEQFQSALSVPIGDQGVFQAVSVEPNAFDGDDEDLAELLISHVTDALDRLDFETEIRTERDRFAALFENVPDAVVSTRQAGGGDSDGDGNGDGDSETAAADTDATDADTDATPIVEAVNPAFEEIFGYEESELIGEPLDEFIVPPDRRDEAATMNRQGRRGEVVENEVKRRTADGLRDFMMRVVPVETDDDTDRTVGLYTDITDQKRRRKRLEILNRVLRHDLRNGMNIINGCAEILSDVADEETVEYADIIRERAGELIALSEKTRAVERTLERDGATTASVDAAAAVRGAIDRVDGSYDVDATISCSVPDQCFVRANDYFETAIVQVLENAIEHNDTDDPTVDVRLSDGRTPSIQTQNQNDGGSVSRNQGETAASGNRLVTLSIADDGPGIPDEERELLQDKREITQLHHASGLGLWLVNWVVTQSGGQLAFRENEPRGTVIEIRVPRADAESVQFGADETATGD